MRLKGEHITPAVWTGTEMIVWGGSDDANHLNTGGRYNPANDSWMATSTTNAPDARGFHTAVWTGSEMVIWGGIGAVLPPMNTGGRYCVPFGPPRRPRPTPHPRPTTP